MPSLNNSQLFCEIWFILYVISLNTGLDMCRWYPVYVRYFNFTNKLQYNGAYPDAGNPDRLGASGKSVENSNNLTNRLVDLVKNSVMASRTSNQA